MLKQLLKDIEINEYIGIVIVFAIGAMYLYFCPETVNKSATTEIFAILSSKPKYEESNGDNVANISFNVNDYDNVFEINGCALNLINIYDILKLNIGDSLKLTVNTKYLLSIKGDFINNPILVYEIALFDKGVILDLEDYNLCKKRQWKTIRIFAFLFALVLFIKVYNRLKQNKNNG